MKLILVAGARPNFMKVASIIEAIKEHNHTKAPKIQHYLVHTGQHYDAQMSETFFKDLGLPKPDIDLGVGSASHADQTAEVMKRFAPVLASEQPDMVMVVGDVNSTIACSLVTAKMIYPRPTNFSGRTRPLVAHVESGLRSFDRTMPEEINRILTDALSDFLFITEEGARENLLRENVPAEKIFFVGNTMVDTLLRHKDQADLSRVLMTLGLEKGLNTDLGANNVSPERPLSLENLQKNVRVEITSCSPSIVQVMLMIERIFMGCLKPSMILLKPFLCCFPFILEPWGRFENSTFNTFLNISMKIRPFKYPNQASIVWILRDIWIFCVSYRRRGLY